MAKEGETLPQVDMTVEYLVPDHIVTKLSTHFTVGIVPGGFYISFYENAPPIYAGPHEGFFEFAKALGSLKAECVARIFMPSTGLEEFISVLQKQRRDHSTLYPPGGRK